MCSFQDNLISASSGLGFPLEFTEFPELVLYLGRWKKSLMPFPTAKAPRGFLLQITTNSLIKHSKKKGCFDEEKHSRKGDSNKESPDSIGLT